MHDITLMHDFRKIHKGHMWSGGRVENYVLIKKLFNSNIYTKDVYGNNTYSARHGEESYYQTDE